MRDKLFIFTVSSLILVLFITAPVIALFSHAGMLDALHTKNYFVTESYVDDETFGAPIINGMEEIKTAMKNVYINCLPYYSEIVTQLQVSKNAVTLSADRVLRPLFTGQQASEGSSGEDWIYDTYDYSAVYLTGTGRPGYYRIAPINTVELVETTDTETLADRVVTQAAILRDYAAHYPNVNFYVYIGTTFQSYEDFEEITGGQISSIHSHLELYQSIVTMDADNVWCEWLPINSVADRMHLLYRSDHHWNAYGAYLGYQSIIDAVHAKTPAVSAAREFDILQVEGIRWIGLTGSSANLYYDEYADDFWVYDLSWMQNYYSEYGQNNDYDIWETMQQWLAGDYPKNNLTKFYDYYGDIFHHESKVTFYDNQTGRNLLIFGDSFSKAIQLPLASHFDHTYVVTTQRDDIGQIMREQEITDVIVVLFAPRLLYGFDVPLFGNFMNY